MLLLVRRRFQNVRYGCRKEGTYWRYRTRKRFHLRSYRDQKAPAEEVNIWQGWECVIKQCLGLTLEVWKVQG